MFARQTRPMFIAFFAAIFASLILISPVTAQQITSQQFQSNPGQLLADNPDGGAQLISAVRDLALADPANLPLIIALLGNANSNQATAIGTGLGQAAQASVATNQDYANQIQKALAEAKNDDANNAYSAVTGNTVITSNGPPGGGGGGGGGTGSPSGGGSSSSGSSSTSSSGTPNTAHNSFSSNFTTGTTRNSSNSVSQ